MVSAVWIMTVKQRQYLLGYLGYYSGSVDGDWGNLSRGACSAFQRDNSLPGDGLGGPETDAALKAAVARDRQKPCTDSFWATIEFFEEAEFRCKCGGKYCSGYPARMQEQVVRIADAARRHFGRPGHVISGLRCRQWNALQGGVENSQHMYGEAVDLRIDGTTADQLLDFLQTQPCRYAYKINETNVHLDIPKAGR